MKGQLKYNNNSQRRGQENHCPEKVARSLRFQGTTRQLLLLLLINADKTARPISLHDTTHQLLYCYIIIQG